MSARVIMTLAMVCLLSVAWFAIRAVIYILNDDLRRAHINLGLAFAGCIGHALLRRWSLCIEEREERRDRDRG